MSRLADEETERLDLEAEDAHRNARELRRMKAEAQAREDATAAAVAEVDDLPVPPRGRLALETILVVCQRGARAGKVAKPEQARDTFDRHIRGLLPVDPTSQTLDAWCRFGAVAGAEDAWCRSQRRPPNGAPSPLHTMLFCAAYAFAFGVVTGELAQ